MITSQTDQMLPSSPMTGPSSTPSLPGPAKRKLSDIPQQDGNGESETDFAAMVPDYVVPARPSTLRDDAETPTFVVQLGRRHLPHLFGPRRL